MSDRFLIADQTMQSWMRRVDEDGERAQLQLGAPVNRFPDFVRLLVCRLNVLVPAMGKVRIAQTLARAGLHLGATTVSRFLKDKEPLPEEAAEDVEVGTEIVRVVTTKHTGHGWHIDFTAVPTLGGLRTVPAHTIRQPSECAVSP